MKKALALVLCVVMLLAVVPSFAEGTTMRTMYGSEVSTLNYLTTGTTWDMTTGANVVDTLIEYDNHGNVVASLAETWEVSDDQLTWTFHIRQGQKWYDYTGAEVAEVTAHDFVAALKYVLTAEYDSSTEYMVDAANIVNGDAYFNGKITDFEEVGVKATDDYTLVFTLTQPTPYLLSCLTYGCFQPAYGPQLEELGADFATSNEKMYYNGAYILSEFEPQGKHVYVKNENNWDAEHVYIERIVETYNSESSVIAPNMLMMGELDSATLDNDIINDWMSGAYGDYVTRERTATDYSYFYAFNFLPTYDEEYAPADWTVAVTNANFRHSIMSGLNRVYVMQALEDKDPDSIMQTTITPATFTSVNGIDYTALPAFDGVEANFFNEEAALAYKDAAIADLTGSVTFPIKVVVTYKSGDSDWEKETILLESQLENLLGTDYIDVIPYAGPSESFLSQTRRAGKYSLMRCNYGADYEDPQTWTDPFSEKLNSDAPGHAGNTYNKMDVCLDTEDTEMYDLLTAYYAKVAEAKSLVETEPRYTAFSEAEACLINNAIIIPYSVSVRAYQVTKLDVYEASYAPCGVSALRYKGMKLHDDFVSTADSAAAEATWMADMGK